MTFYKAWLSTNKWPGGSIGEESACNAGDPDLIPGLETSARERNSKLTPVFLHGLDREA